MRSGIQLANAGIVVIENSTEWAALPSLGISLQLTPDFRNSFLAELGGLALAMYLRSLVQPHFQQIIPLYSYAQSVIKLITNRRLLAGEEGEQLITSCRHLGSPPTWLRGHHERRTSVWSIPEHAIALADSYASGQGSGCTRNFQLGVETLLLIPSHQPLQLRNLSNQLQIPHT